MKFKDLSLGDVFYFNDQPSWPCIKLNLPQYPKTISLFAYVNYFSAMEATPQDLEMEVTKVFNLRIGEKRTQVEKRDMWEMFYPPIKFGEPT